MDRWTGKVAIVTGASVGIGAAIAEALVNHGLLVVGAARRIESMEQMATKFAAAKGKFYPVKCDLTKEEDILKMFRWVEEKLGGVDVLVNNAGVLGSGPIIEGSTESFRKTIDVNVIALTICTREAVRSMKKRNAKGHIINVNSLAGHYAEVIKIPLGLYTASKYAVTAITHGVRHELTAAKLDIKVTAISPGAVRTDMIMGSGMPKDVLDQLPMLEATDIVDAVIYILSSSPQAQVCDILIAPHEISGDASVWRSPQDLSSE